jgi:hypothetical protein
MPNPAFSKAAGSLHRTIRQVLVQVTPSHTTESPDTLSERSTTPDIWGDLVFMCVRHGFGDAGFFLFFVSGDTVV